MQQTERNPADACTGRRLEIAQALRDAELLGEFRLVFQPVFELSSGEIVAVETLLRWHSPTLGEVSPVEFIPIAEDTGAIVPIGDWVLREGCETIAGVCSQTDRPLELGINISAHQLARPGFAQSVRQTLAHAAFPTRLLTLEITEGALMRSDSVALQTLTELHTLGTQLVLDDFGAGLSSPSWLKTHPLEAIKIDRGCVNDLGEDPRDRVILDALIRMARALGCAVTAEGVETEEQLDVVKALGCDRAQGFLLARPLCVEQLLTLLA